MCPPPSLVVTTKVAYPTRACHVAWPLMRVTTPNQQRAYFKRSLGDKRVETRENVDLDCNSDLGLDDRRRFRTRAGIDRSTRYAAGNSQPARVSESAAPVPLRRARSQDERDSALLRGGKHHGRALVARVPCVLRHRSGAG